MALRAAMRPKMQHFKGHTKRLYAKLGVHSREELQRLIDVV